jgi:uncharacterized protein YcnI
MRARGATRHARWAVPLAATLVALAVPGIAAAHVTLHPDRLPRGATDVELTFRCPTERDDPTVALAVYLPTETPLLGVLTDPPPGWTARVHTVRLAHPVETDDGEIGVAVDEVAWRATAGGIPAGQYRDFTIAVGSMPDTTGVLAFRALQTYRDGTVVRWVQVPDALDENPPSPAPELTLYAPSGTGGSTALWLSVAALVLAAVALAGVAATRVRRRSRSSRGGPESSLG